VTPGERTRSGIAVVAVLSVAFALFAHFAIIDGVPPAVGAALSLVPLILLALVAARRVRPGATFVAAVPVLVALWLGWGALTRHFSNVFFLEHAGTNLALAFVFGRTLVDGREALCTRFARLLHEQIGPDVERYTRQVTIAWTAFFAALFVASCTLYLGGFLAAWSLLANIASPLLVGAMFVVEYAVRVRVLPHHARVGILGGIRAFSRHFAAARFEAPR
jgi:uncharacterized membrane protein